MDQSILHHRSGFTLIELSIVLVIIGLIVGGVLVGQDLIHAATIRSQIKQVEEIQTSIHAFRLQYNELPGDFDQAEAIWGSDVSCPNSPSNNVPKTATCNGDNNGRIESYQYSSKFEMFRFWQHLANANLIPGKFTGVQGSGSAINTVIGVNSPAGRYSGSGLTLWGLYMNGLATGGAAYWPTYSYDSVLMLGADDAPWNARQPVMSPVDAFSIDAKLDDGLPGSGWVTSFRPASLNPNCASGNVEATATYLVTRTNTLDCTLLFNLRL